MDEITSELKGEHKLLGINYREQCISSVNISTRDLNFVKEFKYKCEFWLDNDNSMITQHLARPTPQQWMPIQKSKWSPSHLYTDWGNTNESQLAAMMMGTSHKASDRIWYEHIGDT